MTPAQKLILAALVATGTTALLVACGGDGGGGHTSTPADITAEVPPAAATSPSVATSYVADLSAVPTATSDVLEPVTVPDMLASDDNAEPTTVN
ncbi:hypothetical protein [Aquabacterium sp.]|uniref:hypothetical protein n=1 Tax=Aquabacterium sp. TaxID=1872578 RepID=UPI003D6C968E